MSATPTPGRMLLFRSSSGGGGVVTLDPLHQYGRPVVRAVPTDVVAEQFRAGESIETIADLFELTVDQVEQALRFELSLAWTA